MNEYCVYACDDSYAQLAGISMLSLFKNNKSADNLVVYILSDGVTVENRTRLIEVGKIFDREVIILDVEEILKRIKSTGITGYDNAIGSVFAAYARFAIGELLPKEVERIIYMDCDTIVEGYIYPLFTIDMHGKALAMAYDCLRNEYKLYIGKHESDPYFNSGVLVMDMDAWRSHKCMERIERHIKDVRASYPLVDQDIINMALSNEITVLSPQFNFLSQYFLYDFIHLKRVYGMGKNWYSQQEFDSAKNDSVIYHFCGKSFIRPWFSNSLHPLKPKYDEYYYESPWKDIKQNEYSLPLPYKIQYFLYKHCSVHLSSLIGKWMQRIFIYTRYGC